MHPRAGVIGTGDRVLHFWPPDLSLPGIYGCPLPLGISHSPQYLMLPPPQLFLPTPLPFSLAEEVGEALEQALKESGGPGKPFFWPCDVTSEQDIQVGWAWGGVGERSLKRKQ